MFNGTFESRLSQWWGRTVSQRRLLLGRSARILLVVAMISAAGRVHPPVRAALSPLNSTAMADETAPAKRTDAIQPRINEAYGKLPVSFEANAGHADNSVRFIARGNSYSLMLTPTEAAIELRAADFGSRDEEQLMPSIRPQNPKTQIRNPQSALLRFKFIGASSAPKISGFDQLPGKTNYLVGNDPTQWRTDMPTYAKVRYQGIYPGIDLVYYGNQQRIEYDLIVAPGANPERIAFEMQFAGSLTIDRAGALIAHTSAGDLRQEKPFIYQEVGGVKRQIEGRFVMLGKLQVGFSIGRYDRSKPLIIDPQISTDPRVKSAFKFGGSDDERVSSIAVDSQGSAYLTGDTRSADFPTMNPFSGTRRGSFDAFVTKLNPEGTAIVYSTYLGGSAATDTALDIAVDASGNAYVAGTTASNDFPTTVGALQTVKGANTDAYLAKLNPSGLLGYSTYLGGNNNDSGMSIAVDSSDNAYVTGGTLSANFPTTAGAFQTSLRGGTGDAYVTKLDSSGTTLEYSTFLAGTGGEVGVGIAVDEASHLEPASISLPLRHFLKIIHLLDSPLHKTAAY